MEVVITAIGPDNRGLADPIVHFVTGSGANIHEIQMYDHDSEQLFAMLLRIEWPGPQDSISDLRKQMDEIGRRKGSRFAHGRATRPIGRRGSLCARLIVRSPRGPCCRRWRADTSGNSRRHDRQPRFVPGPGGAIRRRMAQGRRRGRAPR